MVLICLAYVVNGGGVNIIGRSQGVNIIEVRNSHIFLYVFTYLKNFICLL